jgi:hypothetical protein
MALLLKQSTAFSFRLGPFLDSGDGVTAETGLTLSQADFRLSKAGGAFAQKNETTSGTHDENGYYTCILNTTDTNTLGTLDIHVNESGALPVFKSFMVVPANVWDSLVGGTDVLDVSTTQFNGSAVTQSGGRPEVNTTHAAGTAWGSGAITAASIASDAITAAKIADNAIDAGSIATGAITSAKFAAGAIDAAAIAADAIGASELAADAATEIGTAVWATAARTLTAGTNIQLPSNGLANVTAWTVAITGNVTGNLSGSVGSVTGAVGSVTGNVGGNVTGSVGTVNALAANVITAAATAADFTTEIQTGLATAAALATVDGIVDTIVATTDKLDDTLEDDAGTFRFTTNALEQAPTGGGAADGSGFTSIPWNASWDAEVQSEVEDALNAYGAAKSTDTMLADIRKVNNVTVTGTGTGGDPWGP